MGKFRDICLQVRYNGDSCALEDAFFSLTIPAAACFRLRISDLKRESLALAALAFARIVNSPLKVQILIEVGDVQNPDGTTQLPREPSNWQSELLQRLSECSRDLAAPQIDDLEKVEVKVFTGEVETSATCADPHCGRGFFTDDHGDSVAYSVVGTTENAKRKAQQAIAVSWSWGDPLFTVKNELDEFNTHWAGAFSSGNPLKETVLKVLTALAAENGHEPQADEGIRLFPHQSRAVEAWIERTYRGVFKMCTGAGKTISALAAVKVLSEKRTSASLSLPPVIVSVPTRVLADQWIKEIKRFGFHSVLSAYNAFEQWNPLLEPILRAKNLEQPRFVVTTYRTFADERFTARLIRASDLGVEAVWIADEMHNLASTRLRDAMRKCERLFPFRLGLSATPEIEGDLTATESLLAYFGNICASYELADGIRDGVLCPYRYFPIPAYLAPSLGKKYLSLLQDISDDSGGSAALINLYRETRELLRTSGVQVARFRDLINELTQTSSPFQHTLVYCPPGYGSYGADISDEIDKDEDERRLIEEVIDILRSKRLSPASILGDTPAEQRSQILERFADGRVQSLCAIGCLDEGVDVPAIRRAIVLYSVDREKQFVQRRGRILRQPRGTRGKIAEIYDIVILPQGADMPRSQAEALLNREMRRYREFARLAMNREHADEAISQALSVATRTRLNISIVEHAS